MMPLKRVIKVLIILQLISGIPGEKKRPNIVFILADDLGFNDVGYQGSDQILTPNLDALAFSGVALNRYYVNPICTPSRSALMTGKYPIHLGMQHGVIYGMERRGLPLSEKILPEYLRELGYSNHIVGKWHLGHYKKEYTPLFRGFDTHLGYWTGHFDYVDHTAQESGTWGLDMRRNFSVAYDLHGKYATDVFHEESVRIINAHDTSKPLFLYVAHAAVHSGNPYEPLRAPDEIIARFDPSIKNFQRRKFAAMMTKLDDSVGGLMAALKDREMLENTIIVFSTDNGGPAEGFNLNAASNWPLRGVKNTLWEGGVRGVGLVWASPMLLQAPHRVSKQLIQIADWMPTLYSAAGGDPKDLGKIDGVNVWDSIVKENVTSQRSEILHNIDEIFGNAALTSDNWKLVNGTTYGGQWDGWYGPAGERKEYPYASLMGSKTGKILQEMRFLPSKDKIISLRESSKVDCYSSVTTTCDCKPLKEPCLFDISKDPCELKNLAKDFPHKLNELLQKLDGYRKSSLPINNTPLDEKGNPKHWNNVWTNFGDL